MKRLKLFFFLLMLIVFFTGCTKDERKVIKFSSWGSQSETAVIKPLLKDFEKQNPNVRVEFIHAPSNYFQKLHLYFAAKVEPDVIFINNIYFPKYYEADLLEDLTPYFKDEIQSGKYFQSTIDVFTKKGKTFAIPRDVSNIVVYYNKTLFDKHNVGYPQNNWKLSDFEKKAKELTLDSNNDGKIDIWGINRSKKMIFWLPFLTIQNGEIIDKRGNITLIDKNTISSLQRYCDYVVKEQIAPTDSELGNRTQAQMFMSGQLGMYLGGRWNIPKFSEIRDFDWDIAIFPEGKSKYIPADASGWAISKNSKNKELAVKLIKFLSSDYSIEKIMMSGLITPAKKHITNSDKFFSITPNKNTEVFIKSANRSKAQNISAKTTEIEDILYSVLEPAFNGHKSVEVCLSESYTQKKLCSLAKCK